MPQVGVAIGAIAGSIATAASATVAWLGAGSIAANLLTSVALSALQSALAKRALKNQRQPGIKTEFTTDGGTKPQTFILGRYATGGHMVCPPMSHGKSGKTSNAFLTYVVALGDVPGQTLESVIIDDEEVEFEAGEADIPVGGSVPSGRPSWWYVQQDLDPANPEQGLARVTLGKPAIGKLSNHAWIRYHDGNQTAADAMLLALYGEGTAWATASERPWTPEMVGKGTPYAVITFKFDREKFSGLPRCKFVMGGVPLYDPRKDTSVGGSGPQRWSNRATWAVSHNPMVQSYNILRGIPIEGGPYWGLGVEAEDLPLTAWTPEMNACDADLNGAPRYRSGIEVAVEDEPLDILEELLKTCSGKLAEFGGVWKPRVGAPRAPLYFFTDDDVILSEDQTYKPFPGLTETYNGVQASYPEPRQLWQSKDAPPRYHAGFEAEDQGRRSVAQLSLPACPYPKQAQLLSRVLLHDNRRFATHAITLPPEADLLEALDSVNWTSEENGYVSKHFEGIELAEDDQTSNVQISMRERDSSDYSWSPDFELPSSIPSSKVVTPEPIAPQFFKAEGIALAGRRPAIRLRWGGWALSGVTGVRWEIRRGDDISRGMMGDPEAGEEIIASGLLPATLYHARISFVAPGGRAIAWTLEQDVYTPDIRFAREDLSDEILDNLNDLEAWIDASLDELDELRSDMDADITAVRASVTAARDELGTEVARVEDLARDNLGLARSYTDTSVQSERVARQGQTDALSARIDQLTAALTSENLIQNGRFDTDTAPWTLTNSPRIAKAGSSVAIMQACPRDFAILLGQGSAGTMTQLLNAFEPLTAEDQIQLRFHGATAAASRSLTATLDWTDASGASIGTPTAVTLTVAPANEWKVYSARMSGPVGAVGARITLARSQSGTGIYVTDIEATSVNIAIEARIAELEAAQVNDRQALTLHTSEAASRFADNEAAISAEAATRATADNAIANRVSTVEASTAAQDARIGTAETAIANATGAIAQVEENVAASFGRSELVRDGSFASGLTWWPSGNLSTAANLIAKTSDNNWFLNGMPAARALQIGAGSLGQTRSQSDREVAPGEEFVLSMAYARSSANSVVPLVQAVWYDVTGTKIGGAQSVQGTVAGAWSTAFRSDLVAPANAVKVRVMLGVYTDGSSTALVTNISLQRKTGFDLQSAASIETLQLTQATADAAIAVLQNTVSANWTNLDGRVKSNATAIADRYTKAQTDSAISAATTALNSTLTNQIGQKANASAVTALTTRVKDTEDGLSAVSDSITALNTTVGRYSASGIFRVQTVASPTGAASRIGISAAASGTSANETAALFLEALTGGGSRVTVQADRFAIVTSAAGTTRVVPFYTSGGVVYMDMAVIKDLSVETFHIKDRAITTQYSGKFAGGARQITFNTSGASNLIIGCTVIQPYVNSGNIWSVSLLLNGTQQALMYLTENGTACGVFSAMSQNGSNTLRVENAGLPTASAHLFVFEAKK